MKSVWKLNKQDWQMYPYAVIMTIIWNDFNNLWIDVIAASIIIYLLGVIWEWVSRLKKKVGCIHAFKEAQVRDIKKDPTCVKCGGLLSELSKEL